MALKKNVQFKFWTQNDCYIKIVSFGVTEVKESNPKRYSLIAEVALYTDETKTELIESFAYKFNTLVAIGDLKHTKMYELLKSELYDGTTDVLDDPK